jgi:multidrug resistance efflux pump
VLLVLGGAYVGYDRYTEGQFYVSTDNAQLTGTPIQVGSLNAGQVAAINVRVGTVVHKDDVLAQVALPSLVGTAQNGDPELEFLGNSDTHVDVTAPSDGVVVAIPVAPGATVAAGQPVVTLVDASHLWVNADVEETNVGRVQVGQPVIVHVDALNEDVPGLVDAVTPATAASFSILPASNTSGNFNKVTQLVPVRIAVSLGNQPALLGASAEVKIQVVE